MAIKSMVGKILVEYVVLMAVIASMAAILVHERERTRLVCSFYNNGCASAICKFMQA